MQKVEPKKIEIENNSGERLIFDSKLNRYVVNNRAYRRRRDINRLYTRKGFIAHLNAIRIVRKKNGKSHKKYVLIDKKVV